MLSRAKQTRDGKHTECKCHPDDIPRAGALTTSYFTRPARLHENDKKGASPLFVIDSTSCRPGARGHLLQSGLATTQRSQTGQAEGAQRQAGRFRHGAARGSLNQILAAGVGPAGQLVVAGGRIVGNQLLKEDPG